MKRTLNLLFSCSTILMMACAVMAQDRTRGTVGDETGRDAVGFRKDSVTKETVGGMRSSASPPTAAQAVEDFMQIQKSNRQLQDMSKSQPLGLAQIAASAKEVNTRAARLKTSLTLPKPPKREDKTEIAMAATNDELLSQIKELDLNVKAFVTNPRFRQVRQADKDDSQQAKEASASLQKMIEISQTILRSAERLQHLNQLEK
jgi:hypothetical protein